MTQADEPGSSSPGPPRATSRPTGRRGSLALGAAAVAVLALGTVAALHSPSSPASAPGRPVAVTTPAAAVAAAPMVTPDVVASARAAKHRTVRDAGTTHRSAARDETTGTALAAPRPIRRIVPHADLPDVPVRTVVATLSGRTRGFVSATAARPAMVVPGSWYGRTSVLPVVAQSATRVEVRLARRPNEAVIWVNRSTVRLTSVDTAILVDLSARRLYTFRDARQTGSYPVGIGLPATPTPTGTYFLAFHAPPNGPGYGPVMLETSAHSTVFQTFEGGNDAIIAIHGPIDAYADEQIGSRGAAISNGCIRMHDSDLVKVARAPDGTPIILVH